MPRLNRLTLCADVARGIFNADQKDDIVCPLIILLYLEQIKKVKQSILVLLSPRLFPRLHCIKYPKGVIKIYGRSYGKSINMYRYKISLATLIHLYKWNTRRLRVGKLH